MHYQWVLVVDDDGHVEGYQPRRGEVEVGERETVDVGACSIRSQLIDEEGCDGLHKIVTGFAYHRVGASHNQFDNTFIGTHAH